MPPMAPEVGIIRTYIDWIVDLPWSNVSPDNLDVKNAAKILSAIITDLRKPRNASLNILPCVR